MHYFFASVWLCGALVCSFIASITNAESEIIFIIISQRNPFHETLSVDKKLDIERQLLSLNSSSSVFIVPHDFPDVDGYWTIFPLIKYFRKHKNLSWLFFLEETTNIVVSDVLDVLHNHKVSQKEFIGHALRDDESTIIHHFDDPLNSPAYPHQSSGFALSHNLVMQLSKAWNPRKSTDFSIDSKYEFAKFLHEECNVKLTHEPRFCIRRNHNECATYVDLQLPSCGKPASKEEVFFAVKTCEKYHKKRVHVVKNTWASDAHRIFYFSDVVDPSIPTVNLQIANVQRGHCEKTLRIIKYFVSELSAEEKWLVIADDDTLLSIPRLLRLLSCYDPESQIALGERYGYVVASGNGYDYITGGGGMVFSLSTTRALASNCKCPSIDAPDDMILGMCLKQLDIPILHLPQFHQARHRDYSQSYLDAFISVSFHKHWMIDPISEYVIHLQEPESQRDEL